MHHFFNIERIMGFMKENNLSKRKFCKLCGFSMTTLNKVLNDDLSLRSPVLLKLSRAMNVEIKELFYK